MKAKLYYVDSTMNSIMLRWEVEGGTDDMIYRVDVKDNAYKWITKYCHHTTQRVNIFHYKKRLYNKPIINPEISVIRGKKTECEINGLGPETLYYFRLRVSTDLETEEVLSNILTTATKEAPPMLFYLFKSAERCDLKGLELFFKKRRDSAAIDAFDKKGETALIKAVGTGNISVVRKLLSAGANVNQAGYGTGRTPLMYACFHGHLDIANVLIQNGANINSSDCNNFGPLHFAVDWNNVEVARLCLDAGANLNKKDSVGWTALMRAVVLQCSEEVVKELLSHKPDIQIKDRNKKTALDLANLYKRNSLYDLLTEYKKIEYESKKLEINEIERNNGVNESEKEGEMSSGIEGKCEIGQEDNLPAQIPENSLTEKEKSI